MNKFIVLASQCSRLLPEDGAFVNVGRGAVVEEKALLHMASEGRLRVALDTYDPEPLPADSPWFAIPSACLSPHIAGPTANGFRLCGEFAMKNLRKYLDGATPDGLVTLEVYDRMT